MSTSQTELPTPTGAAPTNPSRNGKRAWTITGLLVLLFMINSADKAVLGIIAQPLSEELGLTSAQIGLVASLFYIPFTIGGLLTGTLSRFASIRWLLAGAAIIWALTMLPMIIAASFVVLLVSRLVLGLFEGPSAALIYTANFSWHEPAKRGFPGAVVNSGVSLAKMLIVPALALLTASYGWRWALVALAILSFAWCLLWLSMWKDGPYIVAKPIGQLKEPTIPWVRILTTPTFITVGLLTMCTMSFSAVMLTWLPSYFEIGLGYSRLEAGSMVALPAAVGFVMMLLASKLSDRMRSRGVSSRTARVLVPGIGVLVSGSAVAALPMVSTPAIAVLVIALGYGFLATGMPLYLAAVSDACPPRQTAGMFGILTALVGVGGFLGPVGTGLIVDAAATPAAGYATSFQVLAVLTMVCAVGAMLFANPARDIRRISSTTAEASGS